MGISAEVDEQALPGFSMEDRQLYNRAIQILMESPFAPTQKPVVFLTTRKSQWLREIAELSETEIRRDSFSFTFRKINSEGKIFDAVVILWDQILTADSPLALLVTGLAREVLGSLNVVNSHVPKDMVRFVNNAFVYQAMLRFFRALPEQPSYRSLTPTEKTDLNEYYEEIASGFRGLRAEAKAKGFCSALLRSQDN